MDANIFIKAVTSWATKDTRVSVLLLCGSHANNTARTDSDIDFVLVCPNPGILFSDQIWISSFGANAIESFEDWGLVQSILVQSIRVFYGSLEVEFGITGLEWIQPPIDNKTADVMMQPMRVLYDPDLLLANAVASIQTKE